MRVLGARQASDGVMRNSPMAHRACLVLGLVDRFTKSVQPFSVDGFRQFEGIGEAVDG